MPDRRLLPYGIGIVTTTPHQLGQGSQPEREPEFAPHSATPNHREAVWLPRYRPSNRFPDTFPGLRSALAVGLAIDGLNRRENVWTYNFPVKMGIPFDYGSLSRNENNPAKPGFRLQTASLAIVTPYHR